MPAVPNTPGNPWLVKGILAVLGITAVAAASLTFYGKSIDVQVNGITTTSTDGVVLSNNTATVKGANTVELSPRLRLRGSACDTDGAGTNDTWDFYQEVLPESAADTLAAWYLKSSKNGAAAGNRLIIRSDGNIYVPAGSLQIQNAGRLEIADNSGTLNLGAALDVGLARKGAGDLEINGGTAATTAGKLSVCATASSYLTTQTITEEMTCATGATTFTSTAHLLPANSYIIGVTARVTQAPADAVTWGMGISGTLEKFAENLQPKTLGQMTSTWTTGHAAGTGGPGAQAIPWVNAADDHVVITFSGDPGATAAKIRITVFYQTLTPPGS